MQKRLKLVFPEKSDYPNKLKILDKPGRSVEYHQLVEASASAYFETKGPAKWLFMKRFKVAFDYLKITKINNLLDAGTGIGFFLPTLAQFAKQITAIDYAQHTLSYAKKMCQKRKVKNIDFIQADLLNLRLKNKKFDVITALSVLEHIPPQKLSQLMNGFKKILKPNGYLIAGWPNEGNWLFKLAQQLEKKLMRPEVFKSIHDKKAKYIPLGHVAKSNQIETAVTNKFKTIEIKSLPWIFPSFYRIGCFKNN
jgi:2-polyprenyl-3-methyl-5-hydroxy-6-metoxy-1,4-benzoquinol methylase